MSRLERKGIVRSWYERKLLESNFPTKDIEMWFELQ
jgi:hypothetical protein